MNVTVQEGNKSGSWMKITEILETMSHHRLFNRKTMNNLRLLGRILLRLNTTPKHTNTGVLYWVRRK